MKKTTLAFIVLFAIIGIIAFNRINSPSQIKSSNKLQKQNEAIKVEKPSSSTQSAESIGSDEINLNVNFPANGLTINQSSVTVEGVTLPQAFVFVNENELKADDAGNFSTKVELDEGENIIVIIASDEAGNNSEKEITVIYDPEITQ